MKQAVFFFSILFGFLSTSLAQEMQFDIWSDYKKAVFKNTLTNAMALKDLDVDYPSSWIQEDEYQSVGITVVNSGSVKTAYGLDDKLNKEQVEILRDADIGSYINVKVDYEKENSATGIKENRSMQFALKLMPDRNAEFQGGDSALKAYLANKVISQISTQEYSDIELASLVFIIDENGRAQNIRMQKSSGFEHIDEMMIKAIQGMPDWKPAMQNDGSLAVQSFEFTIGNEFGC